MNARLLAASACLSLCTLPPGPGRRAGAHQPVVGARRLHHAQEHGEAARRAQGADRRARRADRRGHAGSEKPASCAGCSRRASRCCNGTPGPTRSTTRDRSCCGPARRRRLVEAVRACGWSRSTRRRSSLQNTLTAHVVLRQAASGAAGARPARPRIRRSSRISARSTASRAICASRRIFFDLDLHDVADGPYNLERRGLEPRRADRQRAAADRAAQGRRRSRGAPRGRPRRRRRRRCAPKSCSRSIA